MKKIYIMSLLGAFIASVLFCSSVVSASDNFKFYFEGEVGGSFADFDSSGWNSFPFRNTGEDTDEALITGIHLGTELLEFLRADIGLNHRDDLSLTTSSFEPPSPDFFYQTKIEDIYTLMFSLYFEPIHYKKFTPYIGAGIGSTWAKISANDTVARGRDDETNLSWQAEAGIQFGLTEHLTLKLGYRYIDMGSFETQINREPPTEFAGRYKGRLTAHEVIFGMRYSF